MRSRKLYLDNGSAIRFVGNGSDDKLESTQMYDTKCYELAELFLNELRGATERDKSALAQAIQDVCDDACDEIEQREARQDV